VHILGITAYGHDSAVALLEDGRILSFVEEERFTRQKHTGEFPENALRHVLERHGVGLADIDEVAFFVRPWQLAASRALRTIPYLPRSAGQFFSYRPGSAVRFLRTEAHLRKHELARGREPRFRMRHVQHHVAHAASVFFSSPFEEAAVLSIDGAGEDVSTWLGRAVGDRIERLHAVRLPHSLGLVYSAVTSWLGFKPWGGEGKVMGLAPYGDPDRYWEQMRRVIDWDDHGRLRVALEYFDYHVSGWTRWTSPRFDEAFGQRREPESELTQRHKDVAAALQRLTDEVALAQARFLHRIAPSRNLCITGGVALNSVTNGRIAAEGLFENVFIHPASNDAGAALGAALFAAHTVHHRRREACADAASLGPEYDAGECAAAARAAGLAAEPLPDVVERTADLLAQGKVVGWFQGRMEAGPRALGGRSILADPRDPAMRDHLNLHVKHRENFRPFAPSVVAEAARDWFLGPEDSPYMLLVQEVRPDKRALVPSITHVDGTARVQTVRREVKPRYHALLEAFGRRTGVPMLLNTSFNVRGEPIVCTPGDAIRCFLGTNIDHLVLGDLLLHRPEEKAA